MKANQMYRKNRIAYGASILLSALLLNLESTEATAAPVFFDDRTLFDAAAGSLSGFEDFEGASQDPGAMSEPGPWNSDTDDSVFSPGDIAEGISFVSSAGNLAALDGSSFSDLTSTAIGPNSFGSDLIISFLPGVNAVAFDVFQVFAAPQGITISLFDISDVLIGTTEVEATSLGGFFGVIDDMDLIGTISLSANNPSGAELIDNLAFGLADATAVPEPGTLALFGLGLAGVGFARRRRGDRTATDGDKA